LLPHYSGGHDAATDTIPWQCAQVTIHAAKATILISSVKTGTSRVSRDPLASGWEHLAVPYLD